MNKLTAQEKLAKYDPVDVQRMMDLIESDNPEDTIFFFEHEERINNIYRIQDLEKVYVQRGLDPRLATLAAGALIGVPIEQDITNDEWRARCRSYCFERAQDMTDTPEEAQALFDQAIAWAEKFAKDIKSQLETKETS